MPRLRCVGYNMVGDVAAGDKCYGTKQGIELWGATAVLDVADLTIAIAGLVALVSVACAPNKCLSFRQNENAIIVDVVWPPSAQTYVLVETTSIAYRE